MKYGTPLRAFLAGGLLVAIAGAWLAGTRAWRRAGAAVAVGSFVVLAFATRWFDPTDRLFGHNDSGGDYKWTHQARVDFHGDLFVIDGDASSRQSPPVEGAGGSSLPPVNPFYEFPYDVLGRAGLDVAIIGAGGGRDIYNALRRDASHVVAIELNQSIYDWMTAQPNSVYTNPKVEAILGEGRHALRTSDRSFDLIQLSLIDTYTASAQGAYALAENFLYTVEAFDEYLDHLKPGGVLFISRWMFEPERETLRLCTIADEALRRRGVADPARHMAVIAEYGGNDKRRGGFVLSRDPLDSATIARITAAAKAAHYPIVYLPGATQDNPFYRFFAASDKQAFFDAYPYRIEPVTDDRPFFFQYFRLSGLSDALAKGGVSLSQVVLFITLAMSLVLSIAIILIPSLRIRRAQPGTAAVAVYFSCLGLGFMLVEIPLIQRFTLYLGHPTHALATILSSLLVSAAIGSLISGRIALDRRVAFYLIGASVLVVLAIALVPTITAATIGANFAARVAISLAMIAPLGVVLGLPLALGVRTIAERGEGVVAWGWACNGAASVVAACLAMILLVYFGFSAALAAGAACYGLAAATWRRL